MIQPMHLKGEKKHPKHDVLVTEFYFRSMPPERLVKLQKLIALLNENIKEAVG